MTSLWTEHYQQHFRKYFHKPFDINVYHDQAGTALKLATYDQALQGVRIYASIGLADRLLQRDEENFGEVILFSDLPDAQVPELFVHALFFVLRLDIPLYSRFSIGFAEANPDFSERIGKAALYFTQPMLPDVFFNIDPESGEPIGRERFERPHMEDVFGRVYQAYFITAAEDAFLDAWGGERFEEELFKTPGGALSLRRASCV